MHTGGFACGQELAALVATGRVYYRGIRVLRVACKRSFSLGVLVIDRHLFTRDKLTAAQCADVLRHEYGHACQLQRLGLWRYLWRIALPSAANWGSGPYFSRPWEVGADVLGGVQGRAHTSAELAWEQRYLQQLCFAQCVQCWKRK